MYKMIVCVDYELPQIMDQINNSGDEIIAVVEKNSTWRFFVKETVKVEMKSFPKWTDGTPDIPAPGSIVEIKSKSRGKK